MEIVSIDSAKKENQVDQEAVKQAEVELEAFKKSLDGKLYAINLGSEDTLKNLIDFIENDVAWTAQESLGVIEVSKTLNSIVKEKKMKAGSVFTRNLEIEAIYFFLSKFSSKGKKEAEKFLAIFKPVSEALTILRGDNETVNRMEYKLEALKHGIEVAKTDESVDKKEEEPVSEEK